MQIISHSSVKDFLATLDKPVSAKAYRLIGLLEQYGHQLTMPDAKPIGRGLWELRLRGRPAIRIIYGFCKDEVILLVAFKKQARAITPSDLRLAHARLIVACGV